jgi:hypothetical protein
MTGNNGPELDEATATALAIVIHNQIEALKVWERKLRTPFLPTTLRHMQVVPQYPKPTLATVLAIMATQQHGRLEVLKISNQFMEDLRREETQ